MKYATRLEKILEGFVARPGNRARVERLFDIADDRGRCGFEKWLQYELVLHLHLSETLCHIEKQVDVDRRKPQDKSYLQIDLSITLRTGEVLDIELKVRHVLWRAIRALKSDCKKLSRVRQREKADASFSVVLCGSDIDSSEHKILKKEINGFRIVPVGNRVNFLIAQSD